MGIILAGGSTIAFAVGAFPVATGGTGTTTVTANQVILGNGTSPFKTASVGSNGQYFIYFNGVPTWKNASSSVSTTTANTWTGLQSFSNASSTLFTCTTCWIGTLGQALNAGNFLINNVLSPVSGGDAANKTYVDNAVAGVNPAVAVQAATTQASDTSGLTYANGASGIGATFTGSINTPITIDGVSLNTLGQRLLVKNDTQSPSGAFNGVYYLTVISTAGTAPVFTRALDYDMPSDINNTGAIPVINGTSNASTQWVITSQVTTIGTDPLTYSQFSLNPSTIFTTAGTGLKGTGNTVSMKAYFATSTADTSGQIPYWNSTNAVPALLTSSANFTFVNNLLTVTNASTTNLSASGTFFAPTSAATTLASPGQIAVNTSSASSSVQAFDGSEQFGLYKVNSVSFLYSTTTATTATTTLQVLLGPRGQKFTTVACHSVGGTANIQTGSGTASTTMVTSSTGTPAPTVLSSNNTFNQWQTLFIDIGTFSASTVTQVTCAYGRQYTY